ncbi:hypothetical protein IGS68_33655 (plasmid) [Skermanella sp. TT6]|uniref:DUF6950 domain-containing protein n=2 Tax=Skermanella cutis TaxID=2775420 RepID=A0ABX7BGS6_9PROT|nr:hypothetical protein [Skermanella sp. TT6]QQP93569.1 hypothetical protein IGS68_33655 [Skermanella sp. TT6]
MGSNPIGHLQGRYTTAIGSLRVLRREFGTTSISDAITQVMGEPVPVPMAGRGDLALVDLDGTQCVGTVDLSGERVAAIGLYGLEYVTLSAATAAWKV